MLVKASEQGTQNHFEDTLRRMWSKQTLILWAIGVVIATVAGPFGTFDGLEPTLRFTFWLMILSVAVLMAYSFRYLVLLLLQHNKPPVFDICIVGLLTILGSPVLWAMGHAVLHETSASMFDFSSTVLYVGLVSSAIFTIRRLIPGFEGQIPEDNRVPVSEVLSLENEQPRLLRRLENADTNQVLRLSAKDHLVEVVTHTGSELLRMRLVDAMAEMEPVKGHCCHRSHWVAEDAIEKVEHEKGQKTFLVLSNGDRVPVSRKYRPELEAAGIV